ncbi:ribonuclease H-like domain, reverse transcriptase, RNA-dependent DNA polymerase [Tanacetum coccineum]
MLIYKDIHLESSDQKTKTSVNSDLKAFKIMKNSQLFSKKNVKTYFLNKIKPTSIGKALSDSSWVEAMQEELLQFNLQQVWILVDLPNGKKAIGTKWVFRNKKDERGIVIRNKARGNIDQHYLSRSNRDIFTVQVYVDELSFGSTNRRLQVQQKEDGIFIIQDKYVTEFEKSTYSDVNSTSTLLIWKTFGPRMEMLMMLMYIL